MSASDFDDPAARGRLNWRCRRGMHELDLLLQRWMAQSFETASRAQRRVFAQLLELPDPELARLLLHGGRAQDPDLDGLVERLRTAPANGTFRSGSNPTDTRGNSRS